MIVELVLALHGEVISLLEVFLLVHAAEEVCVGYLAWWGWCVPRWVPRWYCKTRSAAKLGVWSAWSRCSCWLVVLWLGVVLLVHLGCVILEKSWRLLSILSEIVLVLVLIVVQDYVGGVVLGHGVSYEHFILLGL